MKYLIVGLGNPGLEYADTRHNIGFMILDTFAEVSNITFKTERYGSIAYTRLKNKQLVLLKPNTYMNLSGAAVRYWSQKENIPVDHILVLVDDIALPFGAIRLKPSGSDAGHNGLKNIAEMLNTQSYPRLRFGVGHDFQPGMQVDYVLGTFSREQRVELSSRIDVAIDALKSFCLEGIANAMCKFNNK